jgi:hypothetical protein
MGFFQREVIQFVVGLFIVIISYVVIIFHRKPLLDAIFGDDVRLRKSFTALTSMGYFLIFIPILLVGINLEQPPDYSKIRHCQRIIYFEAGLLFIIGLLHMGIMAIFSAKLNRMK